ncbi:Tyrosine--tRNA ligase [compost metagenome]
MSVATVLNKAGLVKNAATARDMLNAGSVKVDGVVVDRDFVFVPGKTHVCQAGKKAFARIAVLAE